MLNQFAMDEHDGYLRIATTTGHVPDPEVDSHADRAREHRTATLDHRRRRRQHRADRGHPLGALRRRPRFVVTFKKTDPLFVFDLSNPRAPKQLGELKIPGFSTYMHMLDDDHLLTIGYDADDHGDFAYFDGVLLQIFDVTDLTDPKLVHKEMIGTRGSSSRGADQPPRVQLLPRARAARAAR